MTIKNNEDLQRGVHFDIIFIVDGSGSIGNEFNKQLQLVNDILKKFGGISRSGIHAGLVVISSNSDIHIRLNDYIRTDDFVAAVKKVGFIFI